MPYLTNQNSDASAGEYDDATAAVLLSQSTGWQVSDPPPAVAPQAAVDRPATVHLVHDQSPESEGDYDAVLLAHGTGWREPEPEPEPEASPAAAAPPASTPPPSTSTSSKAPSTTTVEEEN